jgi:hypothetical protein
LLFAIYFDNPGRNFENVVHANRLVLLKTKNKQKPQPNKLSPKQIIEKKVRNNKNVLLTTIVH